MSILDVVDGAIIIKPECLVISPFKELWEKDKSKGKALASDQLKYIWFFAAYKSPYFAIPEDDRSKMIIEGVIKSKKFIVDDEILHAIVKYKELNHTAGVRLVESAQAFANKLEKYFKDVDLDSVDAKKVTDIFINMPKIIDSLNSAMKKCMEEQASGVKVRGGHTVGMFEDK